MEPSLGYRHQVTSANDINIEMVALCHHLANEKSVSRLLDLGHRYRWLAQSGPCDSFY